MFYFTRRSMDADWSAEVTSWRHERVHGQAATIAPAPPAADKPQAGMA